MAFGGHVPDLDEFREMVEKALEEFPEQFLKLIENLAIVVEDVASPQDAARVGVREPMQLLGLYTGVPFTQWGRERAIALPDVIKIYRLPLLSSAGSEEEIGERVRKVVLHELGHRAGLGEARLRELGVY
jgi:predicted Zn-dependent protease with MMP-like domain